ncbi:MAG TPA: hypothetical protein VHU40_22025 [Polyangia bacterium]|nr:hypothetical protein [Polyangia bacterium]
MQVVCANCQLSFQAPDGAAGLVCPICRSPLQAPEGGGGEAPAAPTRQVLDWAGGSLDDLVALLSGPASSARIEVLTAGKSLGEVHVIAGGVSEALFEGKSTHDALDKLRAAKNTEFRVEPRLPNPANGDLAAPGPDQGKLEERPLATLMRYCEEFVLTANIEVWRASENAKVEYKRGEIVGVTVGGIDAPERLSEVMKWASGSYRLVVPKLSLPAIAPKAPAPAAVVAPRSAGATSKTIFGMPALDPAAIAAAAEKARQTRIGGSGPTTTAPATPGMPAPAPAAVKPTPARPAASATTPPPPAVTTPSKPTTVAAAPPAAASTTGARANPNRTIFGVAPPAASTPAPAAAPATPAPAAPPAAAAAPAAPAAPVPASGGRQSSASRPTTAQPVQAVKAAAAEKEPAKEKEKDKERDKGKERGGKSKAASAPAAAAEENTLPTVAPTKTPAVPSRGTPVWTYVAVGFVFGLVLLGVYRMVVLFSN